MGIDLFDDHEDLKEARKAIRDFLKWWDSLPVGHHGPPEVNDWLNAPTAKTALKKFRQIAQEAES